MRDTKKVEVRAKLSLGQSVGMDISSVKMDEGSDLQDGRKRQIPPALSNPVADEIMTKSENLMESKRLSWIFNYRGRTKMRGLRMKYVTTLARWRERILACRSSGLAVQRRCGRQKIDVGAHYRWERLCMTEAESSPAQAPETAREQLVRIEPELLPSGQEPVNTVSAQTPGVEQSISSCIRIQRGQTVVELPVSTNPGAVGELVRTLSHT